MPYKHLIPVYTKNSESLKNRFFLGSWCYLYERKNIFDKYYKNTLDYHWNDKKKLKRDFKYLNILNERLLKILSNELNKIHKTKKGLKYWRIILYPWLSEYSSIIFDRWETCNYFQKKHKNKQFYFLDISPDNYHYYILDHDNFAPISSDNHYWNHLIFKRVFKYLNNKNIFFKKKNINKFQVVPKKISKSLNFLKFVDYCLSHIAIRFNKVIFETFYFPTQDFLKLCLKNFLVPARFSTFFNFKPYKKCIDKKKRLLLKNSLKKVFNDKKTFESFLFLNLSEDLPTTYLENFLAIKKHVKKFAKTKKIIFSMHHIDDNDYFKIFVAEACDLGSKLVISDHGGGFKYDLNMFDDHHHKIADKKITWDKTTKNKIYLNLSPTLPIIKEQKYEKSYKKFLTIMSWESSRYQRRIQSAPHLNDDLNDFLEIINFVKSLKKNIKQNIKFRLKYNQSINSDQIFADLFGENLIDKSDSKNIFLKTVKSSKLVLMTYPSTSLSEVLYLNVPTILICKRKIWMLKKSSEKIINILKKNKMFFETFEEAKKHIEKIWDNPDLWWSSKKVQAARKIYLNNFFKIEENWFQNWNNQIFNLKSDL